MNIVAIVQARLNSSRLPHKVMKTMNGKSVIQILLSRLSRAVNLDEIIIATTDSTIDDDLVEHLDNLGFPSFRGSENDVLERFFLAAEEFNAEAIVRITGDCPFIDPQLVDKMIDEYRNTNLDYISNIDPPTFPDGLDIEIFSMESFRIANNLANSDYDREHVTPIFRNSDKFRTKCIQSDEDFSHLRLTLDEQSDFELIQRINENFYPRDDFTWEEIVKLSLLKPEIFEINNHIKRNKGSKL